MNNLTRDKLIDLIDPLSSKTARWTPAVFAVVAAIFLLSFGPVTWELPHWERHWLTAVTLLTAIVLIFYAWSERMSLGASRITQYLGLLTIGFAATILLPAVVHWIALLRSPGDLVLNVSQMTIADWTYQHWYFTEIFLLFPLTLALLHLLVTRLSLVYVSRTVAVFLGLSASVQYYQGLVDTHFLNNWVPGSGRTGGLSTDPNAYQLQIFLLAPLLIAVSLLETKKGWIIFCRLVAALAVAGLVFTGGRTAIGGVALLIMLTPLIFASAKTNWTPRTRIALAVLPLILLALGGFALANMANELRQFGLLGGRFAETIEKTSAGGIQGLLFDREARGLFWKVGWALLLQAPLAGWGAGGFRLQYPNEAYLQTGEIPTWVDYVCNHFLMVPIDLGVPALMIQGLILTTALTMSIKSLRETQELRTRLALNLLVAANTVFLLLIVVMPPAFPDVAFAWALNLAVLFTMVQRTGENGILDWYSGGTKKALVFLISICTLISLFGSYSVTFGKNGYQSRFNLESTPLRYERNCYGIESNGERRWQWCGKNARIKLPLNEVEKGKSELLLYLSAGNPDINTNPLLISYGGHAGPVNELTLSDTSPVKIRIPLDEAYVVDLVTATGKSDSRIAVLSLDVSRTWSPKRWGLGVDSRELGVSIHLPSQTTEAPKLHQ